MHVFVERVRKKTLRDPAGVRTQDLLNTDLLNTSQTFLPLSHSDPWQRSGKQARAT